jgi:hypothetical protein
MPTAPPGLDGRHDLVRLVVADQRSDRRIHDHDLGGENAALAMDARHELLADHRLQRERQHRADLLLLVRREHVDDAVHGLLHVRRMQRGERQVARLRERERRFDGLEVAHFADEHDVRVLTQHRLQRLLEPRAYRRRPHAG